MSDFLRICVEDGCSGVYQHAPEEEKNRWWFSPPSTGENWYVCPHHRTKWEQILADHVVASRAFVDAKHEAEHGGDLEFKMARAAWEKAQRKFYRTWEDKRPKPPKVRDTYVRADEAMRAGIATIAATRKGKGS